MRRRESAAGLFVVIMLALGAAIMLHWRAVQPRTTIGQTPQLVEWLPATPVQLAAARQTIGGQLSAFAANDFVRAVTYQSRMLRYRFENPDMLREVITVHYPQFCHFTSVEYRHCLTTPRHDIVRVDVQLVAKDGHRTSALYMLHQENGQYRVAEVMTYPGGADHPMTRPAGIPPPMNHHGPPF